MLNSPAQKIKERLSIEEVVSSYIKLEKSGSTLKARCPFHNEKTPSFFVSPDRGSYYCFGCGASGDIFTFVEEFEGLDFKGALKLLAERAGIPLDNYNREEESEKDRLYKAMEESAVFFEENLSKEAKVMEYLKSRGLNDKSIKDFRIGYVKPDWRELYGRLAKKGFSDSEIEKAGLAKRNEKGMYDRFRGRVMFPINDTSGRVIAFSGRIFSPVGQGQDDGKSPKYLNSPETPIFSKNAVLFGLDKAKDSIRKNNFSILVEGQMDLVLSHQAGYKNTIATSGTALSDSQVSKENVVSNLGLVRRLTPNIVLAFDADKAGLSAAERAGRIALSLGMDVKIARLAEGVDPADLISKEGPDAWREAVKKSKHIIEFMLDGVLKNSGDDMRKAGRGIKEKVLPYVDALESSIEKNHFIKIIGDSSGIPQVALRDDLSKVEHDLKYEKKEIEGAIRGAENVHRKDNILRRLLGIILWQRTLKEKGVDPEEALKTLAEILKVPPDNVLTRAELNKEDLIFEAEVFYGGGANLEKDVGEMLSNLREEYLKEELANKMRELHMAEEAKDFMKSAEILRECQTLNDKIQEIKNGRLKK